MKFENEEVQMVRRVADDDPAFNPDREMFVIRRQNGMEVYAAQDDLEDFEAPKEGDQQDPKMAAGRVDPEMTGARANDLLKERQNAVTEANASPAGDSSAAAQRAEVQRAAAEKAAEAAHSTARARHDAKR